jgi:fibronectin-binding autotransporter adhesin
LQGSGVIGHVTFSGSSASRLAPGTSAGILTTSNFNATAVGGGAVELDLNGAVAGNSYDQLNVRGSVNLTGLSLQSTLNYTSTAGQPYTLVNNDGSDAVTGTFTGLPQNKKFYLGGELFQISYTGGTGNDVVLTRLVTPPPPTLTIERVAPASVRLLWPTNDPAFRLLSHTNLTTTNWVAAMPQPTLVGTNHILTNVISGVEKYYRLVNP